MSKKFLLPDLGEGLKYLPSVDKIVAAARRAMAHS